MIKSIVLALVLSSYHSNIAIWTGNKVRVQTVTYQIAWNCEYNYNGQRFWKVFTSHCPGSIRVY